MPALHALNALDRARFAATLGAVFEHSPWVAEQAWAARPFATLDALHGAMMRAVRAAPRETQRALLRAHPELAGREAREGTLTADSASEQGRLGLTSLSREELERLAALNRRYQERFGFPCIIALRLHADRGSVIAAMARRVEADPDQEWNTALEQIAHITRGRLERLIGGG